MATFTPPTVNEVAPFGNPEADPMATRLMRFYASRPRGAAVFKMSNGVYYINRFIEGLSYSPTTLMVIEAWPSTPIGGSPMDYSSMPTQVNNLINQTWFWDYPNNRPGSFQEAQVPSVQIVYFGGHTYQVSAAEATDLTNAGLGAYIT